MASCGMDHSVKIWCLDKLSVHVAIQASFTFNRNESIRPFKTVAEHYPEFSTREVHHNYVDCVKWIGNLVLSKVGVFGYLTWYLINIYISFLGMPEFNYLLETWTARRRS